MGLRSDEARSWKVMETQFEAWCTDATILHSRAQAFQVFWHGIRLAVAGPFSYEASVEHKNGSTAARTAPMSQASLRATTKSTENRQGVTRGLCISPSHNLARLHRFAVANRRWRA